MEQTKTNGAADTTVPPDTKVEASAPPIDVQPPVKSAPRAPIQMTKEENLEIENLSLKFENLSYRRKNVQDVMVEMQKEERILTEQLMATRKQLGAKYNMDPNRIKVAKDGTLHEEVLPSRPAAPTTAPNTPAGQSS